MRSIRAAVQTRDRVIPSCRPLGIDVLFNLSSRARRLSATRGHALEPTFKKLISNGEDAMDAAADGRISQMLRHLGVARRALSTGGLMDGRRLRPLRAVTFFRMSA